MRFVLEYISPKENFNILEEMFEKSVGQVTER